MVRSKIDYNIQISHRKKEKFQSKIRCDIKRKKRKKKTKKMRLCCFLRAE